MSQQNIPGRESDAGRSSQENPQQGNPQQGDSQNANLDNPQEGSQWSNYQTKELSSEGEGGISAEEAAKVFEEEGE